MASDYETKVKAAFVDDPIAGVGVVVFDALNAAIKQLRTRIPIAPDAPTQADA